MDSYTIGESLLRRRCSLALVVFVGETSDDAQQDVRASYHMIPLRPFGLVVAEASTARNEDRRRRAERRHEFGIVRCAGVEFERRRPDLQRGLTYEID